MKCYRTMQLKATRSSAPHFVCPPSTRQTPGGRRVRWCSGAGQTWVYYGHRSYLDKPNLERQYVRLIAGLLTCQRRNPPCKLHAAMRPHSVVRHRSVVAGLRGERRAGVVVRRHYSAWPSRIYTFIPELYRAPNTHTPLPKLLSRSVGSLLPSLQSSGRQEHRSGGYCASPTDSEVTYTKWTQEYLPSSPSGSA